MSKTTPKGAPVASVPPAPALFVIVGQGATPIDEGAYPARVASVLNLGIQAPPPGGKGIPRHQYGVGFELQGATVLDVAPEAPPVLYKRYNIQSWGPKAEIPKLVRAILGRDAAPGERLNPAEWLSKPVTIAIEHAQRADGGTSARVASVTRCTNKALAPLTATPLLYPGSPLTDLPEWAQEAIAAALHPSATRAPATAGYDDDISQ